ncbi:MULTISPECIES: hypothetical protein [Geobacillus]|nr:MULTISPECIES: hypothetical protein [Geobacillus]KPC98863.1 hypothetical protein LR69_02958 [Geobacillus sp. BCO2]
MPNHLPMEENVMDMLIGGFSVVMLIAVATIVFLWRRNREGRAFLWILAHFLLLSLAVFFALKAISFDLTHVQASEEISLFLGKAGLAWGAGMVCLLAGIVKLSRR